MTDPPCAVYNTGVFYVWIHLTIGILIELVPTHPLVDQSVLLRVTQINGPVRSFSWFKGEEVRLQNQILAYSRRNNPPETPGQMFSSRFRSFANASLEISNLSREDQGDYTVQVILEGQERSTVSLLVYAFVTKPIVRSSAEYAIGNQTVTLTCDTMNSEKIRWGKTGKKIPPEMIRSSDNTTITFPNIKPLDAGLYWCEAENTVSKMTSDIYTLDVYCICGSTSELSAGAIAGITIGTILVLVLLVGGTILFLSFKRHKPPVIEEPREEAKKNHDPPMEYYNVQAMPGPDPVHQEPTYMDLQYSSHDTYSDLQN
ncbi:carcinoembryonic antigen-related cell adhesion molecule 7-like [Hyla sarda]|uniref:carcinoembryonic antigen-related cell adhesion molecule 7-like n=1 Tax=Hyla sarda TaxID=327740 RepID=UPI0024C210EC|nr:carcinoembryonic antigen-related cell adhesion molecule 7-like [Hyla sarda]